MTCRVAWARRYGPVETFWSGATHKIHGSRRTGNAERRCGPAASQVRREKERGKKEKKKKKREKKSSSAAGGEQGICPLECPLSRPPSPSPVSTLSLARRVEAPEAPMVRSSGPFTCVECTSSSANRPSFLLTDHFSI